MGKIKSAFLFLSLFSFFICSSQSVDIQGQVYGNSDVEGIHIINKTASKFATTTATGSFNIRAKVNDTIVFSSLQYKLTAVRVTEDIISQRKMTIILEEQVNALPQVTVGKILSGDLEYDVKNAEIEKPIDFYDVGIPGYTGKPKTQSERRLHEADAGKMIPSVGLGFAVNFHKLMNAISGRTKMLKERVRLEANEVLMHEIKNDLSELFFKANPLDKKHRIEFFYFVSEDNEFEKRCKGKSEIEIYQFLEEKFKEFQDNLKESKN